MKDKKWMAELRDMTRCPDCYKKQERARKWGELCDNKDCDCYVGRYRKKLTWFNENWG